MRWAEQPHRLLMTRSPITLPGMALLVCGTLALSVPSVHAATASRIWWDGTWNCRLNGRPAQMRWRVVNNPREVASGTTGPGATTGLKRVGSFSENGGPWTDLRDPRQANDGGLFFRSANGNRWFLARAERGRTTGWATAQGKRLPLVCWRR